MKPAQAFDSLKRWWAPGAALDAPAARRADVAALAGLAREHLRAGRAAADQRLPAAAALLYGEAIARFAQAQALGAADASAAGVGAMADAAAVFQASPRASRPEGADALLLLREPQNFGTLTARRLQRALDALERVGVDLGRALYPASDAEISGLRLRRQLAAVGLLVLVVAGAARWLTAPHNVARGKPVTASSIRFGTPQALVNGAIEWGTFGLHTGGSGREWATIDLVKFYSLSYAEIYSRGDGRFEFNLPLQVELSDDGSSFRSGGACKDLFTQAIPCVVDLHGERARYVRVSAPEVVLAEVKVFGQP